MLAITLQMNGFYLSLLNERETDLRRIKSHFSICTKVVYRGGFWHIFEKLRKKNLKNIRCINRKKIHSISRKKKKKFRGPAKLHFCEKEKEFSLFSLFFSELSLRLTS